MPRVLQPVKRRLEYDDISAVRVWWWRASTMMSASLRWSVWWLSSCVPAPSSPYGNCSRHDRFGSRTAQLRARWSSYVAQPSTVQLRWTQMCGRGAGASSGCYVDVARASTGAVCDTDKLQGTPRWHTPISTPTGATRPATRPESLPGRPSINRWAPADQRTENIAAAEGYELGHWLPDDGCE